MPAQARVIPADAMAVLTFNIREIAADRSGDEHLFPDIMDKAMIGNEIESFSRAIDGNGGQTGVATMSDILMFVYQTGNEGYFGVAVELEDSAMFGNLMRIHFAKEYNIVPLSMGGIPLMQFDTTAAVFGWTNDVALLLYPLGNHGIPQVTAQCTKLLKQQKENSVLANEKFQEMEKQTFALGLWVQTKSLLTFTDGGSLIEAITHDVETYNYLANFEDGEILIRSEWHLADEAKRDMIREFEFPCDTSLITSFLRGRFDVKSDSLAGGSFADAAFDKLPIAEEDYPELFSSMTGDFISVGHSKIAGDEFETHCFLLSDPAKAKAFITSRMQRDSIPLTTSGWKYNVALVQEWRMIMDNNMLTLTNHPGVDGRPHAMTANLAGYMAWFNFQKMLAEADGGIYAFIPLINTGAPLLSEHVTTCSSTLPVQFGNVRHSEIVFRFRNREVNGLVQTEELVRKIYFGK